MFTKQKQVTYGDKVATGVNLRDHLQLENFIQDQSESQIAQRMSSSKLASADTILPLRPAPGIIRVFKDVDISPLRIDENSSMHCDSPEHFDSTNQVISKSIKNVRIQQRFQEIKPATHSKVIRNSMGSYFYKKDVEQMRRPTWTTENSPHKFTSTMYSTHKRQQPPGYSETISAYQIGNKKDEKVRMKELTNS